MQVRREIIKTIQEYALPILENTPNLIKYFFFFFFF